jgi:hypothetical protein
VALDLVIWDSHPLATGATPKQVFIDGIPQIEKPFTVEKPPIFHRRPRPPNFDEEAKAAIEYDGLPPLDTQEPMSDVIFTNVSNIFLRQGSHIKTVLSESANRLDEMDKRHSSSGIAIVKDGEVVCAGSRAFCPITSYDNRIPMIDLEGGSIS